MQDWPLLRASPPAPRGLARRGLGLTRRFAQCFTDRRDPRYVEHSVETLVGQRVFGLALGYEDLNDHGELPKDPTFAVLAGKLKRYCGRTAGKSTLNLDVERFGVTLAGEPERQVIVAVDDPGVAGFGGEQRELTEGDDAPIVLGGAALDVAARRTLAPSTMRWPGPRLLDRFLLGHCGACQWTCSPNCSAISWSLSYHCFDRIVIHGKPSPCERQLSSRPPPKNLDGVNPNPSRHNQAETLLAGVAWQANPARVGFDAGGASGPSMVVAA